MEFSYNHPHYNDENQTNNIKKNGNRIKLYLVVEDIEIQTEKKSP